MDNLLQLLQSTPNISINVQGDDLISFGRSLISMTRQELRDDIEKKAATDLLDHRGAMAYFGVSSQTLWRWRKRGYLKPVSVGGKLMYRRSDCVSIINGKRG